MRAIIDLYRTKRAVVENVAILRMDSERVAQDIKAPAALAGGEV